MTSDIRDPLADVLALLRPEAVLAAELRASGRWSLAFDAYAGVKFGVVVEGECLIAIRGRSAKTLRAGDVFLLGGPPPYLMASDMETPSRSASEVLGSPKKSGARLGSGPAKPVVHLVGGRFVLDRATARASPPQSRTHDLERDPGPRRRPGPPRRQPVPEANPQHARLKFRAAATWRGDAFRRTDASLPSLANGPKKGDADYAAAINTPTHDSRALTTDLRIIEGPAQLRLCGGPHSSKTWLFAARRP